MADNDKRQTPPQPAEDYYGRPTGAPQDDAAVPREGQDSTSSSPRDEEADRKAHPRPDVDDDERTPHRELTEADEKGVRPREASDDTDDGDLTPRDASGLHPYDPRERAPGASLDELPDGDGPRSDAGTNPLSDVYRYGHPDRSPDRER
ncbi:hypothetical protein OV208_06615 [Corallococcus sp. bb12-1]|uniref:hypothetical protein n=1 Tax=Corallococcus sp. bb12-1 TaxID=2996784 RepID=UPI00226F49E5|nr:hypothetical protein [Corallococcus sp. bb12-1]MCY1040984.1 hypothetical protein [Corallococcus sp. bb12-1]